MNIKFGLRERVNLAREHRFSVIWLHNEPFFTSFMQEDNDAFHGAKVEESIRPEFDAVGLKQLALQTWTIGHNDREWIAGTVFGYHGLTHIASPPDDRPMSGYEFRAQNRTDYYRSESAVVPKSLRAVTVQAFLRYINFEPSEIDL